MNLRPRAYESPALPLSYSAKVMSSTARRAQVDSTAGPDVPANLASFTCHLRAEHKAPSTIVTYAKAVTQLADSSAVPARSATPA